MKKNVLKAMSVGLSAITIASTLSVPVYAEGPEGDLVEPAPATSEQPESPEAGKPAPTNLDEKAAAKDAKTLDERYTNEKDDANFWTEGPKEVLDQVQDVTKAADEDNFPDDTFEDGTKAGEKLVFKPGFGWIPRVEVEDVTFEDKANDIEKDATDAGKLIHEAAKELAKNVKAAEEMDKAKGNADTAVDTISEATSDAAAAVDKAEAKVADAVKAVDEGTTTVAQIAVNQAAEEAKTAEKTLEEKKEDFDAALSEFKEAKKEYEKKARDYAYHRNAAAGELEVADWNLKAAQQQLAELEKKVQEKQKEYAESAAGQLYNADFMANGNFWTMFDPKYDYENLKAVIEYYVLNGEVSDFSIKPMDPYSQNPQNGDATFEISYVDANGDKQVAHYGFRPNFDGTFDIYDTELKYEYEIVKWDPLKGTTTELVSKTQSEMEEMVKVGAAVKRYIYTDWAGKHYLTEEQLKLMGQKPANYKFEYVIALPNGAHDVWWDPMSKDQNEKYVGEIARFGWFDFNGNYNETIINSTTKEVVKTLNGTVVYSGTVDDAESVEAVKQDAEKTFKNNLARQTALSNVKKYGIAGLVDGKPVYITPSEIVDIKVVQSDSKKDAIAVAWTVDGRYVPIYDDNVIYNYDGVNYLDNRFEEIKSPYYVRITPNMSEKNKVDAYVDKFKKDHPDLIVKGGTAIYEDKWNGYKWVKTFAGVTVEYYNTYDINVVNPFTGKLATFDTLDDALAAVNVQAFWEQKGADTTDGEWVYYGRHWYDKVYVYDTRNDYVVGAATSGDLAEKIETDASYNGTGSFVAKVKVTVKDTATMIQHFRQDVVDSLYRKTAEEIFNYAAYTERLKEIKQQTNSYQNLLKQTADAKKALEYAKKEVDRIQLELWRLDKDFEVFGNEKAWGKELKLATIQLNDAQERYDTLTEDLKKASQKLADRLEEERRLREQQNQGGPTGGPTINYSVIPTISSIPEATILPEAVPLAAPTRRVRQVAGVVEEEATEEEPVVEETPEETTEVTVTETEENPVVIDDEDVARAGGTQRSFFARTWWAWLLLVIAAIGGAVAYTKKKSTDLK